jgi:O-antigen/teichoic acid export membrane protein
MILNTYTPRFGIDYHLGRAALGEFTAIQYFVNFGGMFVAVVCQAALPVLARSAAARSSRQFFGIAAGLVGFVLVGCILASILIQIVGRQVLAAIYGASFAEVQPLFAAAVPCMFFIFAGSVAAVAGTALRIYRLILFAYIASAVAAAGLTWILVPHWGIFGSFLALGAAGIAQCLVLVVGIVAAWFSHERRPDNG